MPLLLRSALILLFALPFFSSPCSGQQMTLQQALLVLENTKPMPAPLEQLGLVDPVKRQNAERIYDEQLNAINVIATSKPPGVAGLLIPFLNYPVRTYSYPSSPNALVNGNASSKATLCSEWPAFAALLNLPDARDALAAYATDTHNSISSRVAAFQVLGYIDRDRFESLYQTLYKEMGQSSVDVGNRLQAIHRGKAIFMGIYSIQ